MQEDPRFRQMRHPAPNLCVKAPGRAITTQGHMRRSTDDATFMPKSHLLAARPTMNFPDKERLERLTRK